MPDTKVERDRSPRRNNDRRGGRPEGRKSARRAPPERRIFVSNIPFEMKWQEVKDMFREQVGKVTYVELFNDEDDKPRGCGILEFDSGEMAKRAVEKMHRYDLKGRKLVVKEDFDNERDKFGRIIRTNSGGRGDRERSRDHDRRDRGNLGQGGNFGNTYGLSLEFLDSLGIEGPLHTRLFIANLAYGVDEKKLREVFRLAGRVVSAELNRDKEGKSRGHGVVEFSHPVEAVQAISMLNNQTLFDRQMTVRFDKEMGPTPEELDQLPSRLPEGLVSVGMGLGSGGNPLTNVAANLPSAQNNTNNAIAGGNIGNIADIASTVGNIQAVLARQLGMNIAPGNNMPGNNMPGNNMPGNNMPGSNMPGNNMPGNNMPGNMMSGNSGNSLPSLMGNPMGSSMASGMGGGNMGMTSNMSNTNSMMGMNSGMNSGMGGGSSLMGGQMSGSSGMGGMGGSGASSSMGYSSNGSGTGYGSSARGGTSVGMDSMSRSGMGAPMPSQSSDTVIVRNLPSDITWQDLREGFAQCGDIKYAEMKEKGTGLVRFVSERDAAKAVNMMDKQNIDGRAIDVRLY